MTDKLSTLDHLLACLGEECGDVQAVVGKALRYGIHDRHPGSNKSNLDRLVQEMHDTIAVYFMLCEKLHINIRLNTNLLEDKEARVQAGMGYASRVGRL